MRVIFLDFDGVLNSEAFLRQRPAERNHRDDILDQVAVGHLNRIVEQSRAAVVVSSTWRLEYSREQLQNLLALHGFRSSVLDVTPSQSGGRGVEIQSWLDDQKGVRGYVVLDDMLIEGKPGKRQVRTTMEEGLIERHVEVALDFLSRRPPWL